MTAQLTTGKKAQFKTLLKQKEALLEKIHNIEESCEGIKNANNVSTLQKLNEEKSQLLQKQKDYTAELKVIGSRLNEIGNQLNALSGTGSEKILDAIGKQEFYFIKNKPNVLFEKTTGLLWANLDVFPYHNNLRQYQFAEAQLQIKRCKEKGLDGFFEWRVPTAEELINFAKSSHPFRTEGRYYLKKNGYWLCSKGAEGTETTAMCLKKDTHDYISGVGMVNTFDMNHDIGDSCDGRTVKCLFPCTKELIKNSDYVSLINGKALTVKEKSQLTLNLFVDKGLIPTFKDETITELFKQIYVEKPKLLRELQELESTISVLQNEVELTTDFDYIPLLARYNLEAIEHSVIKYYEAVQQWAGELLEKLENYEKQNEAVLSDFNAISVKLAHKYVDNDKLTEEENKLLKDRQAFFKKYVAVGMNGVKAKILSIKHQAEDLERRIDEIDESDNSISELGKLEKEKRVSFEFLAENTAKIIRNALGKMDYFRNHHDLMKTAIDAWDDWTTDYLHFKTTGFSQLRNSCEEDGIDDEIWQAWCNDWQNVRLQIEKKLQPLVERGLEGDIPVIEEVPVPVVSQLISILATYKEDIDKFYLEDKKGVYQQFVFQEGGDLQEKFESEIRLYRCTTKLQTALQNVIFNCKETEDRIFILNWASDLLDIQINGLLEFIADRRLNKISEKVLAEFSELRLKNLDAYLNDAKAYGLEKERREKQYNSLMFKMRKDLMKKDTKAKKDKKAVETE